jgi:hypothetical protein
MVVVGARDLVGVARRAERELIGEATAGFLLTSLAVEGARAVDLR